MRKFMVLIAMVAMAGLTQADTLASWNLDGNSTTPASTPADYLNAGLGITASSVDDPADTILININRADALCWRNLDNATTEAEAISGPAYIEFSMTASSTISITNVALRISTWADGTGSTASYFLRSSTDDYASNVSPTYDISSNSIDPGITNFAVSGVSGSGTITLRLYVYSASAGANDYGPFLGIGSDDTTGVTDLEIQGGGASTPYIMISTNSLNITEGATNSFNVVLSDAPPGAVTVNVSRATGSTSLQVASGSETLIFSTGDWNIEQTVEIEALSDADYTNDTATITCADAGGTYLSANVNVTQDDTTVAPVIVTSTNALDITEGSTGSFDVSLNLEPAGSVTVTVSRASGSTNLAVAAGSETLVFSTGDWSSPQTVTIEALADDDMADNTATISCADAGGIYISSTVTITQTDTNSLPANTLLFYENFQAKEGNESGVAWADSEVNNIWLSGYTKSEGPITVNSDLFYAGLEASSGNGSVNLNNPTDTETGYTTPAGWVSVENGGYYCSFLLNISDFSGLSSSWGMDSPIFSFFDLAGRNVVCLRSDGSGGGYIMVANSKYEVVNGPTDPQCSDEIALTTNTTYLIVLGADDVTDNSSGSFKIWINPTSLGGTAPTATTAGQWLLSFGDSNDNIVLGSEDQTAGGSVLTGVNFDELRVGNSYAAVTPASGSSANDTDADNLPDDWEQGYFGDLGANPGDPASNGINTVMECYIAGLDPTDSAATLTLDSIDPLTWSAATGRTYTIWWSSNLLSGFSALQSNVTIGAYTDAVHNADAQGFYKLEVKIAE